MIAIITARRTMMPMMSASEREVPVVGRSYSPAFLGWCSAMRSSLIWTSRSSSVTLGTPDCVPAPRELAGYAHRQFSCQPLLLRLRNQPGSCPRGRRGGVSKCVGTSRTRQAATPYFRMMGSSSHSESKWYRSKSYMREQRACGSPICGLAPETGVS
jgi:hypothetical protein